VQAIDIGDAEPINDGVGRILKLLDLVWQNDKLLPAAGLEANRLRVVEESRKLSSLLLPAVLRALPAGIEHLIISPDSELAGLPWELLIDSEGRYLIERVRISYADSARTLVSPLSKTSEAPPVLFTDPRYNLSSQGSLAPGTRRAGSQSRAALSRQDTTSIAGTGAGYCCAVRVAGDGSQSRANQRAANACGLDARGI
jgi:hypothetical protein